MGALLFPFSSSSVLDSSPLSIASSEDTTASSEDTATTSSVAVTVLGSIPGIASVIVGKDGLGRGGSVGWLILALVGEADGTASLVGLGVGDLDGLEPGGGHVFFQTL